MRGWARVRKHLQSAKRGFSSESSSRNRPYNARLASQPPTHLWAAVASDQRVPPRRVSVVEPANFDDAQALADRFKRQQPVILNLQQADSELSRRMVDFCAGLTYALDGRIKPLPLGSSF